MNNCTVQFASMIPNYFKILDTKVLCLICKCDCIIYHQDAEVFSFYCGKMSLNTFGKSTHSLISRSVSFNSISIQSQRSNISLHLSREQQVPTISCRTSDCVSLCWNSAPLELSQTYSQVTWCRWSSTKVTDVKTLSLVTSHQRPNPDW